MNTGIPPALLAYLAWGLMPLYVKKDRPGAHYVEPMAILIMSATSSALMPACPARVVARPVRFVV